MSERYGTARLKQVLGAVPGVKTANLGVQQVADDKCDVLKVFGPYWSSNHQTGRPASLRTRAPGARLTEGQPLIVDVMTPGFDSYVNVEVGQGGDKIVELTLQKGAIQTLLPKGTIKAI